MMLHDNFSEEHIRELQIKSRRDPVLLERAVYAFGLLEALKKVGLSFIFKGGTCLMLLMEHPRRLSMDIDIIVEPYTDLDKYLALASEIFPFKAVDEQKRIGKNKIEKRHFKFTYDSPINNKPLYILLDVLFEHNNYSELVQKEIKNDLLLTEPEYLTVSIPSANCILADKLTAFAPHTTGIPIDSKKDMEIMKQFYDVSSLLDIFSDFKQIGPTYKKIAQTEIAYRGIESSPEDCLWDTFESLLCIASRGKVNKEEYSIYVNSIHKMKGLVYAENFTPDIAAVKATKIMYMVLCLLIGAEYLRVNDFNEFLDINLENVKLSSLYYMRKVNPEAYAYIVKTDRLLSQLKC